MTVDEQAIIVYLLQEKGFNLLLDTSPTRLQFDKRNGDDYWEILILLEPSLTRVKITANGEPSHYTTESFDKLKDWLENNVT